MIAGSMCVYIYIYIYVCNFQELVSSINTTNNLDDSNDFGVPHNESPFKYGENRWISHRFMSPRICINNGRDCAEHLSIISSSSFAKIASQRALDFIEQNAAGKEVFWRKP